jgi:tRNA A-37 threonylcarbamoyl transferase component Bud32
MNRFLNTIMATNGLYQLNEDGQRTGNPTGVWPWGSFGIRLGGRRSADGMIYDLPNAPMNMTSNNKVVAKFIFSDDDDPENEIKITNLMAKHRIGPKLFKSYSADVSKSLFLRNVGTNTLNVRGGHYRGRKYVNLFQQFIKYNFASKSFNRVYIIIMENLYDNPSRGVVNGFTLNDIISVKSGTENVKIPVAQLRKKYEKMHELGVIHGDMHGGNIIIQQLTRGRFGSRIIDFGRSIYRPGVHFTNATARQATNMQERLNGTYRWRNNNMWRSVQSFAGGVKDAQKLKSGIVSIFNSLVKKNAMSKERAKVLRVQLLAELSPIIDQYKGQRNVARLAKLNAEQRGSLGKYNKSAQARVLNNFVQSMRRRKASGIRKLGSIQAKKLATRQRRQGIRTFTAQKQAELNLTIRLKNLEKQLAQSLERRKASRLGRMPHYAALFNQKLASAQGRRAASEQRRQDMMNWEPGGAPVSLSQMRRQNASAERRRQNASAERRRQNASAERRRQNASAERRRQVVAARRRIPPPPVRPRGRQPPQRANVFDPFGIRARIRPAPAPPSPPRAPQPHQPYPPGHPRYLRFRN